MRGRLTQHDIRKECHAQAIKRLFVSRACHRTARLNAVWAESRACICRRRAFGKHEGFTVIALREQPIVRKADQPQIFDRSVAAASERSMVMKLEKAAFGTAFAVPAHKSALPTITLVNLPDDGTRNVTRARAPRPGWAWLACRARVSESSFQGLSEQRIRGAFDDDCQIPIGHLMAQQLLQLGQLVMHSPHQTNLFRMPCLPPQRTQHL